MSTLDDVTQSTATSYLTGRVKWFNNKAGYGFITVTDGEKSGSDIFIHHSAINVESQQYKYLMQGEYVQFVLASTNGGKHEFQASNVSGINSGKLMCETRFEFKTARNNYKKENTTTNEKQSESQPQEQSVPMPKQTRPRARKDTYTDKKDTNWTLVKNDKKETKPRTRKQ